MRRSVPYARILLSLLLTALLLAPQSGPTTSNSPQGRQFLKATLTAASGVASNYTNVPGGFRIRLLDLGGNASTVKIEEFVPANMVGAAAAPNGTIAGAVPGMNNSVNLPQKDSFGPKPDMDLHAYDSQGNHVGMNYQNQQYYNVQRFTEYAYVRVRGRQMAFKISSDGLGVAWQLGTPRLDVRPDGRR